MYIRVNKSVNLMEGGMQEICLTVRDHHQSRERVIPISIAVVSNGVTSGMFNSNCCTFQLYTVYNRPIINGFTFEIM